MNEHKERAENNLRHSQGYLAVESLLAMAQVNATLYLADQQKATNLIEIVRLANEGPTSLSRNYEGLLVALDKYLKEELHD